MANESYFQVVVNVEVEQRYSYKNLVVRVMKRGKSATGPLAAYPLNFGSGMFADEAPFHGLEMSGHFNDRGELIGFRPLYYSVMFIETQHAKAMAKMLAKIDRVLQKADAREVGDVFMAFCEAVGATSTAICHVDPRLRHSTISENPWRFASLAEGRDRIRRLCVDHGGNPVAA